MVAVAHAILLGNDISVARSYWSICSLRSESNNTNILLRLLIAQMMYLEHLLCFTIPKITTCPKRRRRVLGDHRCILSIHIQTYNWLAKETQKLHVCLWPTINKWICAQRLEMTIGLFFVQFSVMPGLAQTRCSNSYIACRRNFLCSGPAVPRSVEQRRRCHIYGISFRFVLHFWNALCFIDRLIDWLIYLFIRAKQQKHTQELAFYLYCFQPGTRKCVFLDYYIVTTQLW